MIFLDASALVAILARESDSADIIAKVAADPLRLYSAISEWESVAALCKSHKFTVGAARLRVDTFLREFGCELVEIGEQEARVAADAFETYGKGRHPASLNMGDCFAYACAKVRSATLVYKGNDFARTDLA